MVEAMVERACLFFLGDDTPSLARSMLPSSPDLSLLPWPKSGCEIPALLREGVASATVCIWLIASFTAALGGLGEGGGFMVNVYFLAN